MITKFDGMRGKLPANCSRLGGTLAALLVCVGANGCYGVNPVDMVSGSPPSLEPGSPGGEELGFEYEVYEVQGGTVREVTTGCQPLVDDPMAPISGFGIGFIGIEDGTSPEYTVEYRFERLTAAVAVRNTSINETVLDIDYDEQFMQTGSEDESTAVLSSELSLIVIGRGVPECELFDDVAELPLSPPG